MLHHKSREWICTNIASPTSLAYQSIPSTSDLRKGSAEEEKSCKTAGMHQYKGTLLCFLSVQQDANRHLYRSCFWKVVIYIILFPIYPMKGYPKWFLYKWMPSSFQKKVVLKSQQITIPFRQFPLGFRVVSYAGQCQHSFPQRLGFHEPRWVGDRLVQRDGIFTNGTCGAK